MSEGNKKKFDTNSNSYIIIYSTFLVVIVAFLLAFVFQFFKPAQDANVALDKKKQILNSLNLRGFENEEANKMYKKVIVADNILNANGDIVQQGTQGGESTGFKLGASDYKEGKLALYLCEIEGKTKYVIPVYGMGLWGPISGYIAINDDKSTVYGAYFNHEGETAGLGAEIKDNQQWQELFQHKKLFADNRNTIALSVEKKIEPSLKDNQVDAVTGATLTSNGVTEMLHSCLGAYLKFFNDKNK